MPAMIHAERVSRSYQRGVEEVHALAAVSLEIETGRFVAFMGPSGSGKSTLLNLVAGIDRPSTGSIVVSGRRLNDLDEDELARWRARHVGLIFQFFNLIPVLSARENVALPLLLTHLDRGERRRRAETALRIVGLSDRADEPTGDLDARNAEDILALLRSLSVDFGKTIVMVTHDPRALRFVDLALHLDKGVLLEGDAADRAGAAIRLAAGGGLTTGAEVPAP
jgi:putative ABC transport system ATP-binding protein